MRIAELSRFSFDSTGKWHVWRLFNDTAPWPYDPAGIVAYVEVTGADPAIGDTYDFGTGTFTNGAMPVPPVVAVGTVSGGITPLEFWRRFIPAERAAIGAAIPVNPRLAAMADDIKLMSSVDVLADQRVRDDVAYMAQLGLIASSRVAKILEAP